MNAVAARIASDFVFRPIGGSRTMKRDWQYGVEEAQRAFLEECSTHAEAAELAFAAHGGPIRFA